MELCRATRFLVSNFPMIQINLKHISSNPHINSEPDGQGREMKIKWKQQWQGGSVQVKNYKVFHRVFEPLVNSMPNFPVDSCTKKRRNARIINTRVVQGNSLTPERWPWLVRVNFKMHANYDFFTQTSPSYCGGTIIGRKNVLTGFYYFHYNNSF